MGKTIWLINHYASHMLFDQGGRHYSFAKFLEKAGYSPVIFCANIKNSKTDERYINTEDLYDIKIAEEIRTPFVFVKARSYTGNGRQRVLNMIDFYFNVKKAAKDYAKRFGNPDVILASSVHPLTMVAGIQLAKRLGVKCICEVRDLWPESLVSYLGYKRNNPLMRILYGGEKAIYKKSDALVFTMQGGFDYIEERGWERAISRAKVFYINNGVDLEQFKNNRDTYSITDDDLNNEQLFKVVYTGSIRQVNNLSKLLDIANCVVNDKIRFLVWGDGDELAKIRERAKNEHIENVIFKGRVDKKYIPYITSQADLNFVHNEGSELFRFGISFNKIFDYFAAGKPIVCDVDAQYNPIAMSGAGEVFASDNPQEIASGIERFASMSKEKLDTYSMAAQKVARQYDYKSLTYDLLKIMQVMGVDSSD